MFMSYVFNDGSLSFEFCACPMRFIRTTAVQWTAFSYKQFNLIDPRRVEGSFAETIDE